MKDCMGPFVKTVILETHYMRVTFYKKFSVILQFQSLLPLPSQCAIKFYFEPVQSSSQHIHLGITLPFVVALLVRVLVCSCNRSRSDTKQNTAVKW